MTRHITDDGHESLNLCCDVLREVAANDSLRRILVNPNGHEDPEWLVGEINDIRTGNIHYEDAQYLSEALVRINVCARAAEIALDEVWRHGLPLSKYASELASTLRRVAAVTDLVSKTIQPFTREES